ncbi:ABC transporter substrate-binding protein [Helicobacter sp. MIT 21-1697]|uniref:ABC transporter substrate-binding protein n=1 Tax=Helicobacter sp. MIT 21-1697 TaxID=2993733 RepID=UPI00224B614C|nr:ABC transporter substrate-binding protein [Helicobacter sp. MIT 21-1697]MCX2717909.1 ABC transporter substrate-binding protein [Helicobacter sp. MIT 21-1697]
MKSLLLSAIVCAFTLSAPFPIYYTDEKGYSTTIHQKPKRIVVAGGMWPFPSVLIMLEGSTKNLVYMPSSSKSAIEHSFMREAFPDIDKIHIGESENIEELLKLKPDLFICHSANIKLCEAMKKTAIPTIEVSVNKWHYDSYETLKGWIDLIAPILDRQKEAQVFLDFAKKVEKEIESAKKQTQKPKALIIHYFDNEKSLSVGGIFADYLLQKSGAQNVITSKSVAKISLEEIYRLNPDIIYINNFNTLMPEDLLNAPLWKGIQAIKNKRVYKFPLGSYRPFAPSVDLPILLKWLYEHNYPQYADERALLGFSQAFYKQYFGLDLTQTQIVQIFTPSKEAGKIK